MMKRPCRVFVRSMTYFGILVDSDSTLLTDADTVPREDAGRADAAETYTQSKWATDATDA